jgi:excisionase family DNA binding protein
MAQKYYTVAETAQAFGVSEDEVKQMLERRELYGYRDGSNWKFKAEDIDRIAQERQSQEPKAGDEGPENADVLLSTVEQGQSGIAASGTVVGMAGAPLVAGGSDLQLADSSGKLNPDAAPAPAKPGSDVGSKVAQFEDLDLALDEDIALEDSSVGAGGKTGKGSSKINLTSQVDTSGDLLLGDSDVTIGGDSGISLVDPSDSGISLESSPDLGVADDESIELGEEDMLIAGESVKTGIRKRMETDDEFMLTPLEDSGDIEESESGSQVIALDTEGDEAATMVSGGAGRPRVDLGDDLMSAGPAMGRSGPSNVSLAGPPAVSGSHPKPFIETTPLVTPPSVLPEAPYSGLQIASLATCTVLLMLCGMMVFDLMRNMWSWTGPAAVNSSLMDLIVNLFEK